MGKAGRFWLLVGEMSRHGVLTMFFKNLNFLFIVLNYFFFIFLNYFDVLILKINLKKYIILKYFKIKNILRSKLFYPYNQVFSGFGLTWFLILTLFSI